MGGGRSMVPFCMFTLCDLMLYVPTALISRAMEEKKMGLGPTGDTQVRLVGRKLQRAFQT